MTDMASAAAGQDGAVASGTGPRAGQPKRRAFTAAYKARILREYDELESGRERGALLRREGLYSSHIDGWRKAREAGTENGLTDKPAGRLTVGFRSIAGTRGWPSSGPGSGPSPAGEVPDDHCRPIRCARHDLARLHPYPPIFALAGLTLARKDFANRWLNFRQQHFDPAASRCGPMRFTPSSHVIRATG